MTLLFSYRRYSLPLRAPLRTAHGEWRVREGIVLRLEDATGKVGFGEAAPIPWFGMERVEAIEAVVRRWGARVESATIVEEAAEHDCLGFAVRSALAALTEAEPVAPVRDYLTVAALLPAGRAAFAAVETRLEAGFRTFKWKVGVAAAAEEWGMLSDLLGRLPEGARLRLDANGAWDRRTAERWLARCADFPIEFVEQPVARDERGAEDLLRGLAGDYPTPIALDESLVGADDLERWLGAGWSGIFVVKPALLADPPATLAQLAKAKAKVVFSSALETAVGARVALQAALIWPGEARAVGFGVWPLFADARFDGPFTAPFIRMEDVARLDPEAVWNALN